MVIKGVCSNRRFTPCNGGFQVTLSSGVPIVSMMQ
ncbi:hypothetical protein [Caulobacter vibrioides]|uniref:Uncharacterized protein n=1 Tax=Caulobacter vibrioides (strain NA1000 / CB15N) TaxID=565050 RepID=A0A0H3IWE5_CAUVN|nr:hypothetical protein [Caulobacter vibrioides]YP_009020522.1 hypothetical protein CCNA_03950 [Caulobacter vibrioides NA1000]AHI88553.1 hypothetical protein CCNA_03950 [Caulobacter vibrioides NA1000]AVH77123.1 hypothetical protein CA607_20370 [Caulobacter vibrioides]QXZ53427.1 hypothetical protein KZH45_07075 [Caulobacter vibrioides]